MRSSSIEQNPELMEDFSNIWKTLEKIKSVEDAALSSGDFLRHKSSNESRALRELAEVKIKKNSNDKKEIYRFILQVIPMIIGWILKSSMQLFDFFSYQIERILIESFNNFSDDFQSFSFENFQSFAFQFIKNFNVEKALAITAIILLPPIFIIIKILCIVIKFLLSEIPFE